MTLRHAGREMMLRGTFHGVEQRLIIKFSLTTAWMRTRSPRSFQHSSTKTSLRVGRFGFWLAHFDQADKTFIDARRSGRPPDEHLATKILKLFDENPVELARSLADTLRISHSTVLYNLHDDLDYKSFYLRWFLHLLTPELREQRCQCASEMIPLLIAAAREGWHHLVTGDKS
jgi:hypothetical protein